MYPTFAGAELVAGYGRGAIYLLEMATTLVTLLGVWAAGVGLAGDAAGLWGAAAYALLSGDLWLQANQPNVEACLNACLIWTLALLLRSSPAGPHWGRPVLAGVLGALASLYKPVVIPLIGLLALAQAALSTGWSRRAAAAAGLALPGLAAWLLTVGYFGARGRLTPFWEALVVYNRDYAGDTIGNLLGGAPIPPLGWRAVQALFPLAGLTVLGLALGLASCTRRRWGLLAVFALGTHLAVAAPGRGFAHYYQLWLPVLSVGAGGTLALLGARSGSRWRRLAPLVGVAILGLLTLRVAPQYRLDAGAWARLKYPFEVDDFGASERLGRKLDRLLAPDEQFYAWGNESGLYFASRRPPPTGVIYWYPLVWGPLTATLSARVLADLEQARPEVVVVQRRWFAWAGPEHPVIRWITAGYRPVPGPPEPGNFAILARRGGRLDQSAWPDG